MPNPVWTPAVVAFLGTPGVGLCYADGRGPAIAWFPLAPGEIYWPSYTSDLEYIRAVNAANVADLSAIGMRHDGEPPASIVNAHFANREFASVVPRPVFIAGRTVATALLTIPEERLLNAPAIMGSPQIGPPPGRLHAATASARPRTSAGAHTSQAAKGSAWTNLVRAAEIRSREFQEIARVRLCASARVGLWRRSANAPQHCPSRRATPIMPVSHPDARRRVIRR